MRVLSIGFGSSVLIERIISIINPESAPVKRMIKIAKDTGLLIDLTYGRKARAVILCDNQMVVLSSIQAETLMNRIDSGKEGKEESA